MASFICIAVVAENSSPKQFEYHKLNIQVKELLKEPREGGESSFVFPISVIMTGVSTDKKWFRFKIFYDLVFFGKFEYEGWCKVDPFKPFETNATPEVLTLE
jgi:hypothetical protein